MGFRGLGLRVLGLQDPWKTTGFGVLRRGPWAIIGGVRSRVTIILTRIRGLITPLVTAHEPPSRVTRAHAGCYAGIGVVSVAV